jgi:hypothetical protein
MRLLELPPVILIAVQEAAVRSEVADSESGPSSVIRAAPLRAAHCSGAAKPKSFHRNVILGMDVTAHRRFYVTDRMNRVSLYQPSDSSVFAYV